MAAPPPNIDLSEDRSAQVVVADWVLLAVATVAVILRFYARAMSGMSWWWDDLAVGVALLSSYGNGVVAFIATQKGIGRHIWAPGVDPVAVTKLLWAGEFTYSVVVSATKICIILFFYRIFKTTTVFRYVLYGLAAYVVLWLISVSLVAGFQCRPYEYFWLQYFDPTAKGECIDLGHFFIANCSLSVVADFLILLVPIPMILSLQLSLSKKLSLIGIFLLGGFGCVAGAVRVYFLSYMYQGIDITWNQTDCFIWSCIEPAMGIISACLPTYKPLIRGVFHNMFGVSMMSKTAGTSSNGQTGSGNFYRLNTNGNTTVDTDQYGDQVSLTHAVGGNNMPTKATDKNGIVVERSIELSSTTSAPPTKWN